MTSPSPSPPPRQQEASNPADAPRLDSAGAIANLAGDHMLYGQVVEVFLEDVSTQISDLAAAIAAADPSLREEIAATNQALRDYLNHRPTNADF